jgi:GNAT superfamily N-acetyltransferase
LEEFDCSEPKLNDWLRKHAKRNHEAGASRTYVVCLGDRVVAYYCLAMGSVSLNVAPGKVRRNMPDPIPVAVLGRLAVDRTLQGRGYGTGLVKDAVRRVVEVSTVIGVRALLVHAISQRARDFYLRSGFVESPVEPMTLMLSVQDAVKTYAASLRGE